MTACNGAATYLLFKNMNTEARLQEIQKYLLCIQSRLLRVTDVVDTLATKLSTDKANNPAATHPDTPSKVHPIQPLNEIFLSFCIFDLVFFLLTVYTCDCWVRSSTDLGLY